MSNTNIRNSSIELLRIISAMGVVILHMNNSEFGGAFSYVNNHTLNSCLINLFECIFICAVNVFIIISGYFLSKTNTRKVSKIVELLIQMGIINGIFNVLQSIILNRKITIVSSIIEFIPARYFIILYSVLYLVSPYINILVNNLDKKQFKKLLILLFVIFSVYSFTIDVLVHFGIKESMSPISLYGSASGYSIVNFILLYFIGTYIGKYELEYSNKKVVLIGIASLVINYICSLISGLAYSYNNPLVIIYATMVFVLFSRVNFTNAIIIELSKATYTCYVINTFVCTLLSKYIMKIVNSNTN